MHLQLAIAVALLASSPNDLGVLQAVAPEYPTTACEAGVEGQVTVEVTSLPNGGLGETKSKGIPLLQAAAVSAALAWRFEAHEDTRTIPLRFVFKVMREADGFTTKYTSLFHPPYEVEVRCRPNVTADPVRRK